jgi:Ni/Co efflux regulator RcnB
MKSKLFLLTISYLLFLYTSYAQQPAPPNFAQLRNSPAMQQAMKNGMKSGFRSFWDGRGANLMAVGLMNDPDIRAAWGVSDEQYQEIKSLPMRLQTEIQKNPEFQILMKEVQAIGKNPFGPDADEETQAKIMDIQGKMTSLSIGIMSDSIDTVITPEQKQKVNESLLANMAEMPMVAPSMYEVLGLTDAQKQEMAAIRKELEPEFEKSVEDFVNGTMLTMNMMFDELEKQGGDLTNPLEVQEKIITVAKKMEAEDPKFKQIQQDIQSKGKQFAMHVNTRMFDVLTDEQWDRLQKLIDNPPKYAEVFRKKIQDKKAASEKAGAWQPGPNSWKPGDAIPESYREERNEKSKFPRTEN